MLEGAKLMGAGAATIALAGAAVGIGNVFSSLIHSVARNPSLAKQLEIKNKSWSCWGRIFFLFLIGFLLSILRSYVKQQFVALMGGVTTTLIFFMSNDSLNPGQSPSSSWSGSWIEKWFGEGSSAAQNQQPREAPEGSTDPSRSTSSEKESSFEMNVLMEPFSDDEAGPSHQVRDGAGPSNALFGSISSETETGGTSVNQGVARPVPPANPVASGEAGAGPSHVVPFPYDDEEVIGGDSVLSIQRRLLSKNDSPSAHEITMARIEAQDLMEVKVEIVRLMAPRDPEGDWDRQGARALDNMRRATGEESLEKLVQLRERIKEGDEAAIRSLKSKMIGRRRRDEDAASSA